MGEKKNTKKPKMLSKPLKYDHFQGHANFYYIYSFVNVYLCDSEHLAVREQLLRIT